MYEASTSTALYRTLRHCLNSLRHLPVPQRRSPENRGNMLTLPPLEIPAETLDAIPPREKMKKASNQSHNNGQMYEASSCASMYEASSAPPCTNPLRH
ncbi:hypothetical protein AVEN_115951-1 [Araneus ventricosus]|uniref:Uncharacterized protein n=1 Tax=Araneus ventricosus TaxID=182803 RepID=A0A4Y2KWS6_ARAVE|nr:hypothetical protein AVEN_115951-1 [Araneus ventricosus]